MKSFTVVAFLAMVASTFAGTARSVAEEKWISVESGVTQAGDTSLSKRTGPETVTCYNATAIDRAPAISVIEDWCHNHANKYVAPQTTIWTRYTYGTFTVLVSLAGLTNCDGVTIDSSNCNRILKLTVDDCNPGQDHHKQGGFVTDLCSQWRFGPGAE